MKVFPSVLKFTGSLMSCKCCLPHLRTGPPILVDEVMAALSIQQREPSQRGFNVALNVAAMKVQKYLPVLPFAKCARVFDPRQRLVLCSEKDMGVGMDAYRPLSSSKKGWTGSSTERAHGAVSAFAT